MFGNWWRISILRAKGWKIEPGVTISPHAYLNAEHGFIGANTYIGPNCRICGKNVQIGENCVFFSGVDILVKGSIKFGARCKLSRGVMIRGWDITIGSELWCNENVEIGGGGWMKPTAQLTIGNHVHLGKACSINVCAPVRIGSYTGIGIECAIFTHSSGNGQSVLEGYRHIELPVTIGSHVSLFTRVMVAPGAVIHDGVTVGAMSYVVGEAAPCCLYAGIPAKEKRKIVPPAQEEKLPILQQILSGELTKEVPIEPENGDSGMICIVDHLTIERSMELDKWGYQVVICTRASVFPDSMAVFVLDEQIVSGPCSPESEAVRDALRRNGMLFVYRGYTPAILSHRLLQDRGIEKG